MAANTQRSTATAVAPGAPVPTREPAAARRLIYVGVPPIERRDVEQSLSGFAITWGETLDTVVALLKAPDDVIAIDLSRGGSIQFARELRARRPDAILLGVQESPRPDVAAEAVLAGFVDVLRRPLTPEKMAAAIARELAYREFRPEAVPPGGEPLYALSPAMRELMALVGQLTRPDVAAVLRGERGSGRKLVAQAVATQVGNGSVVVCDCAADPRGLGDALFGRTSSAASPVENVASGSLLHAARGGVLYVQNIGEAPTRVQARLARLLRDREATIDEGAAPVPFDVAFLVGIERDFDLNEVDTRIHPDLWKRVSSTILHVPSLRERRNDIPLIANARFRRICAEHRVAPKTFSRPALTLMSALPWRDNGGELTAVLTGIVHTSAPAVGLDDLLRHVRLDSAVGIGEGGTLRQARTRFERDYILAMLEQHRGRIAEAAQALGIQRTNLYRKIRMLKVAHHRARLQRSSQTGTASRVSC